MKKKPETIDCVEVKRRAQRKLAKALAGKTPEEQVTTLRRMAAQSPLWKRMTKADTTVTKKTRSPRKRHSTG